MVQTVGLAGCSVALWNVSTWLAHGLTGRSLMAHRRMRMLKGSDHQIPEHRSYNIMSHPSRDGFRCVFEERREVLILHVKCAFTMATLRKR